MGNQYSQEEREEALKLADEIGTAAAARRLGNKCGHAVWLERPPEKEAGSD